jgi:hypothetical protein
VIVFATKSIICEWPFAVLITTTRWPGRLLTPTVTVAVTDEPPAFTFIPDTVILESIKPLLSINRMALAPANPAPVMVITVVAAFDN